MQKVWKNESAEDAELLGSFDDDIPEINTQNLTVIDLEKEALTTDA